MDNRSFTVGQEAIVSIWGRNGRFFVKVKVSRLSKTMIFVEGKRHGLDYSERFRISDASLFGDRGGWSRVSGKLFHADDATVLAEWAQLRNNNEMIAARRKLNEQLDALRDSLKDRTKEDIYNILDIVSKIV